MLCVFCKTQIVYKPGHRDGVPGTVYSEEGLREVQISGICETCYDDVTGL